MINSSEVSLKSLFTDFGYLFVVPNYQRSYVWLEKDVVRFLDDCVYCLQTKIQDVQYQHYFGQIILRVKESDRANRSHMEIVDGQQRITTFSILVSVLRRKLISLIIGENEQHDIELRDFVDALWSMYLHSNPEAGGTVVRKLRLSSNDNGILFKIISPDAEPVDRPENTALTSTKNIYGCYTTTAEYINNKIAGMTSVEQLQWVKDFLEAIVDRLKIVLLKPDDMGYCYALYQIVNDRGVSLTVAELLKARTMELLSGNDRLFSECENIWEDILSDSGEETKNYLMWHYAAVICKGASDKNLQADYERNIFNCFGKRSLNEQGKTRLSEQIRKLYANIKFCRVLKNGTIPVNIECHQQICSLFQQLIIRLKNTTCIPVILNILNMQNPRGQKSALENTIFLFSKFFFVTKTVSKVHAGSILKAYYKIAKTVLDNNYNEANCKKELQAIISDKGSKAIFESWLEGDVYNRLSTAPPLFLLYMLDTFYTSTGYTLNDLKGCGDPAVHVDFMKISTEHILGLSTVCANDETERSKNKLGNLTLIGSERNNELDDKEYIEKKPIYAVSPFAMTRAASEYDQWALTEFQSRQRNLVDKAKGLFVL